MNSTDTGKPSRLKPWLWFALIWVLSVGALAVVAGILRWVIR